MDASSTEKEGPQESNVVSSSTARNDKPGIKRLSIVLCILLSFILGLPFWLKLTEIYRASLPFSTIEEQTAHVMLSSFSFPCYFYFIFTEQENVGETSLQDTLSTLSQLINNHNNASFTGCGSLTIMATLDSGQKCLHVGVPEGVQLWPCGLAGSGFTNVVNISDDNAVDDFLNNYFRGKGLHLSSGMYTILSLSGILEHQKDGVAKPFSRAVVGKYRLAWTVGYDSDVNGKKSELIVLSEIVGKFFMNGAASEHQIKLTVRERGESMPLSADGKAILSFSLLNADPNDWIFDWDFNSLERCFLSPVLDTLRPVFESTVESQVLYYTPNAVQSFWDNILQMHIIKSKDLPFFVNENEWHLDTSMAAAGRSKLLHFAIYVPAARECPLQLEKSDGSLLKTNGFTSPGWGGVVIYNPASCSKPLNATFQRLFAQDMESIMQVVIAQLRVLLGLPAICLDQQILCVPVKQTGFSEWELDVLLRRRAAADVTSSASTLRSLSHLVQSLPNMVIKEEIGIQVRKSLLAATMAEKNALRGFYVEASDAARRARVWAEEAFFQPSIMSLLYLPLEHHFAIYTPFFVPVLLHTVLATLKEIKRYRKERIQYLTAYRQ